MGGLLSLLIFAILFYLMMRVGCGAHHVHGHDHPGAPGAARDPVCGMNVAADHGYTKMYRGTAYRFCSRNCLDRFDAEPGKYVSPASAEH